VSLLSLTIDGQKIEVPEGSTVLDAAQAAGIYVPTLCHDPDLRPYGACRLCIVEIEGVRGLPTSCTTPAAEGMVVRTETDEIQRVRRTIVELAIADHPEDCQVCSKSDTCGLLQVARYLGVERSSVDRLRRPRPPRPRDDSNPAFSYDPEKCILCGICVRVCQELQGVGAIDFASRSSQTRIASFASRPLSESTCQTCGECVERCPTGALIPRSAVLPQREVRTICPYCGVGCSILLGVRGQSIVRVRGARNGSVNNGSLCVKGRFGFDFVSHPDRLTRPLVRRDDVPRDAALEEPLSAFREATWDEALGRVADALGHAGSRFGADAIGVLSSAKCTNEENYLVQKLARAVLGTNNVDHCARLCHSSTVMAAQAAFGDGAMSGSISDIDQADLLFVIGSNTTECHPIIARRIKQAVNYGGARLMVADPRAIDLSDLAEVYLDHWPGTDVALLNGLMRQLIMKGTWDKSFVANRCEDFEAFAESLEPYTLEVVSRITDVPEGTLRRAAELFGSARAAMVIYGMGITQHTTGTDNVKAIANLLMLTGNMGRPGAGFAPLRGQNNVQGACDMGALPGACPGYQKVTDPAVRASFQEAWGRPLSETPGLTLTDMMVAAHDGRVRALYIVGENPMMSEPDLGHARQALAALDFVAVQDLFLTETAQMADVVLPAASFAEKDGTFTNTERRVQLLRRALEPPGEARRDWEIVADLATRLGYRMDYAGSAQIMDEIAAVTPIYGGISHARLDDGAGIQWPCWDEMHKGTPILHHTGFTRGRGKFHVVYDRPPAELPGDEYPLLLTTGRVLEHYHGGSMTHRSRVLQSLEPGSYVELSPGDAEELGIADGDRVTLRSPRGSIETRARTAAQVPRGMAFMSFHWGDAPANALTSRAADPLAGIPEFKVCAVRVARSEAPRHARDEVPALSEAQPNEPLLARQTT